MQVQIALNDMDRAIGSAISIHAHKNLDEVKRLCNQMGCIRRDASVAQATLPSVLIRSLTPCMLGNFHAFAVVC